MYEEPKLWVILFPHEDVIRTSSETEWEDENVDLGGWT